MQNELNYLLSLKESESIEIKEGKGFITNNGKTNKGKKYLLIA